MDDHADPTQAITGSQQMGQPSAAKANPLAPSHLDLELQQKTMQIYAQAREQEQAKKQEAEIADKIEEKMNQVATSFGFLTKKDFDEAVMPRMTDLAARLQALETALAQMRPNLQPAQNSGILDGMEPKRKNPLLLWGKYD